MGLSDDLRKFIDKSYDNFEGYPEEPEMPNSGSIAADLWGAAFASAFDAAIAPSAAAGLLDPAAGSTLKSILKTQLDTGLALGPALDEACSAAADTVADGASAQKPPEEPLGADDNFLKGTDLEESPENGTIGKQIADLAQTRFGEWIVTGTFTGFATTPAPAADQPWGAAPDPPPDDEEEEED